MTQAPQTLLYGLPHIHLESGDIAPLELAGVFAVSQADLARMLGVSRQNLAQSPHSSTVQQGLRRLEYLFAKVCNLTGSDQNARIWFKMGHPDFEGVAPLELMLEGHAEAVEDLVQAIETGVAR